MSNSLLKSIRFNMDDEKDKELYHWLSRLPRGEFSESTKLFWKARMEIEEEKQSPESIWLKKMQDQTTRIENPWLAWAADMKKEEGK